MQYWIGTSGFQYAEWKGTSLVATAGSGYLRLRREDYQAAEIARGAEVVRQQASQWSDAFIYFKHEESGLGPKLAQQMGVQLGEIL